MSSREIVRGQSPGPETVGIYHGDRGLDTQKNRFLNKPRYVEASQYTGPGGGQSVQYRNIVHMPVDANGNSIPLHHAWYANGQAGYGNAGYGCATCGNGACGNGACGHGGACNGGYCRTGCGNGDSCGASCGNGSCGNGSCGNGSCGNGACGNGACGDCNAACGDCGNACNDCCEDDCCCCCCCCCCCLRTLFGDGLGGCHDGMGDIYPTHKHKFSYFPPTGHHGSSLKYPPPYVPAAVIQYPYYTVKGPDDFFLDDDRK
jgi:hypothetical protein